MIFRGDTTSAYCKELHSTEAKRYNRQIHIIIFINSAAYYLLLTTINGYYNEELSDPKYFLIAVILLV